MLCNIDKYPLLAVVVVALPVQMNEGGTQYVKQEQANRCPGTVHSPYFDFGGVPSRRR